MTSPEVERVLRERIQAALASRDETQLHLLSLQLGMSREHPLEWYEQLMREELAASPHEIQQYWSGDCNCTGHLN